jgi:phosphate transport system substrate-binding protein
VDGSSTVYPITEAVAEEFIKLHPDVKVTVGVSGTGGGFKKFCAGETDINDASRPIKQKESEACQAKGIEWIELKVAFDGISVVVNPQNDWVECLTVEELKRLWEPASPVKKWSDLRPEWPDEEIRLYGPDTDSGTFDYFTEAIVGEEDASRADYTASADDYMLVHGVAWDKYGLGYFGYAYYAENTDKLRAVAIDAGEGCIAPSPETIEGGKYKSLSRPLFIYVSKEALQRPEVEAFVRFYLTEGVALILEVGYVPLGDEAYDEALDALE